MKNWTKYDYLVLAGVLAFLIYKFANLTFRFGDGNAYFYMANALWHGTWPYKDFFLADPPMLVLFLALFKPILGNHWLYYSGLAFLLEAGNALIIYLLFRNRFKLAWVAPILYLFSFSILGTAEFTTGVQLTAFFSLLAWYSSERNWPVWSGVFFGLATLTKLYALPVFIGFWFYNIIAKRSWLRVAVGFATVCVAVLLPFLISSPDGLWRSIVLHQLHRPAGTGAGAVWSYFFSHEWALLLLAGPGLFLRRSRRYLMPFGLGLVFLLLFKDLYYVYIAYLVSYLVFFAVTFLETIYQEAELKPLFVVGMGLAAWCIIGGIYNYENSVQTHGRFENAMQIGEYLKTQNLHQQIYGSHEVAPLLALISGKSLFDNHIDTNTQVFAAHTYDLEAVSQAAARTGVYLTARISEFPDQGIATTGFEGYFSRQVFDRYCKKVTYFPSTSQESDNYIGLFDCHID